jgi:3-oxoacyl-[acyl-carrier protein] reductase
MDQHAQSRLREYGLFGQVAIVTGSASGIGEATVRLFAAVGAKVVVADLNPEGAEAVATAIRAEGGEAMAVRADVGDEASVEAMFAAVEQAWGAVDVLVNNAAGRTKKEFMEMSVAEWDAMHQVCTRGTFLCSRLAVRQMIGAEKGGAIVNISSVASIRPMIFANAHYDSAKAGVNALTRDMAIEFAQHGIRVNAVLPGGTDTQGNRTMAQRSNVVIAGPAMVGGRRPMGRVGRPEELAQAILFLASPAASYITGQLLPVDGGYTVS